MTFSGLWWDGFYFYFQNWKLFKDLHCRAFKDRWHSQGREEGVDKVSRELFLLLSSNFDYFGSQKKLSLRAKFEDNLYLFVSSPISMLLISLNQLFSKKSKIRTGKMPKRCPLLLNWPLKILVCADKIQSDLNVFAYSRTLGDLTLKGRMSETPGYLVKIIKDILTSFEPILKQVALSCKMEI